MTGELAARSTAAGFAFKSPTHRPVSVPPTSAGPGPGTYHAAGRDTFDEKQLACRREHARKAVAAGQAASAAARMQSGLLPAPRALPLSGASTFPSSAPGAYDPKPAEESFRSSFHDASLPSAVFRSAVPIAGGRAALRASREQRLGVVPLPEDNSPGPGQYSTAAGSLREPSCPMSSFAESRIDRFGKLLPGTTRVASTSGGATPGPGQYHRKTRSESAPISSSVFMSGTTRQSATQGIGVPGPAYYKPEVPQPRRSHHLNAQQRWVPVP